MRRTALGTTLIVLATLAGSLVLASPATATDCSSQILGNGDFESGSSSWTASTGVIRVGATSQPAYGGTHLALLGGKGSTNTTTLSQTVTLPAGCTSATLSYWLHVDTQETATSTQYDRLAVQVGSTTVASYSNLDKNAGYIQRTVNMTPYIGQTVSLKFTGTEDYSLATNFAFDDITLSLAGDSGQRPSITNPGNQTSMVGQAASLHIQATDPQGDSLSYSATGLPAGLAISGSGLISGTPSTVGSYSVTVTAGDPGNNRSSVSFLWLVNPSTGDMTRTPASPAYTAHLTSDLTGHNWTGHVSTSFTNASASPLPEVYLRLWDNYHGSCPTTPISVTNVTGGAAGALTVTCTAMKITLPTPLNQGQSGTIGYDLSINVPNGSDRFGYDGAYNFIGNAIPVLAVRDAAGWHMDPYTNNGESFYTLASDFDVTLNHPTSLLTPATGTSTETTSGSSTVTHATAAKVRDFAWAAGPFTKITATSANGVINNVYYTSGVSASSSNSMLTVAKNAIDAHSARFGSYPYGESDVVLHSNFWFGGMEYPGLVLSQASSVPVIHELAHNWFYGIVGNDEYNSPWLDEGFTDYATDLQRGIDGSGCGITWQSSAEKLSNSMAYWDAHSSRYSTVIYGYGKCTLHDLRRLIGIPAMENLMKSYAQAHWYGVSTVADFKAAAQAIAGSTDLTSFWTNHRVDG